MASPNDPFDLARFLAAQAPVYERVREELRRGRKTSHWIWYVFPQMRGLGSSAMSERYGISSLAEARAYLDEPALRSRLEDCTRLVLAAAPTPIGEILPYPDDLKFQSSMTLFEAASGKPALFAAALDTFFAGARDEATARLME